ncbi:MAG TPA: hypothetical protein VJ735_23285 [Actinomycetes bacterium]|nr:hypothetical protein [Actinomycetes bacterium]
MAARIVTAIEQRLKLVLEVAEQARLRCRVGWRRLPPVVGHASTVRRDPCTLG